MIYLREAFKNGVKIKSERCIYGFGEQLSLTQQQELLKKWNKLGAVGPITWKYSFVPLAGTIAFPKEGDQNKKWKTTW